ncbi:hypothetical protein DPEC_G00364680 [Dallia pectoralis]|nr:hypothetical protein DPEC_G00364680 [Dallia pectoralis]
MVVIAASGGLLFMLTGQSLVANTAHCMGPLRSLDCRSRSSGSCRCPPTHSPDLRPHHDYIRSPIWEPNCALFYALKNLTPLHTLQYVAACSAETILVPGWEDADSVSVQLVTAEQPV